MDKTKIEIEPIIIDIEKADLVANDRELDRSIREDSLVRFVQRNSADLIALLDELKELRADAESGTSISGLEKTHRVIIEGFSDKNAEAALSSALDKTAPFFTESQNIAITVQQLIELPGGGHRATLEVHITPFAQKDTLHVKGRDIELKRDKEHKFRAQRKRETDDLHRLVFEHFSELTKAKTNGALPPSFLINITDAKLMHYMLERQFLKAERARKSAAEREERESPPEEDISPQYNSKNSNKILVRRSVREPD